MTGFVTSSKDDNIPIETNGLMSVTALPPQKFSNFFRNNQHNNSPQVKPPSYTYTGRDSPFFRPSTPQTVVSVRSFSTPNGTRHLTKKKLLVKSKTTNKTDEPESKSTIIGATSNLISCIVGAGIIGMPFAINQTGLVTGIVLIIIVAFLTDKSLRLLIETGKHADVQSYETLMEAIFGGRTGFVFISVNMFLMSFGAMVCYLLIIKQTFSTMIMENSYLMGILGNIDGLDRTSVGRWGLVISSLVIILPLSMQRDMANLSKTSTLSVIFDILMVLIIAVSSPIKESLEQNGGIIEVMQESTIHISTVFIGLGVLSFAFVCQDSSFIIAGSLHKPTKDRWGAVTRSSLFTCAMLSSVIGVTGYLGFLNQTKGNVLQNFLNVPKSQLLFGSIYTYQAINVARILLGLTMFCVYPLSSYVARHVLIVLFFSGKTAHSGDDHSVLARMDRRIALTFVLYICALVPALICNDLGTVLALTGAVAGSCLSYLGPGIAYLGVHGKLFLRIVEQSWSVDKKRRALMWQYPREISKNPNVNTSNISEFEINETGLFLSLLRMITWYILLMPLWCCCASKGGANFEIFEIKQALQSPSIRERLGKITHRSNKEKNGVSIQSQSESSALKSHLIAPSIPSVYGSIEPSTLEEQIHNISAFQEDQRGDEDEDSQEVSPPGPTDFALAISYIVLGFIALFAGIFSISVSE